MIAVKTGPVRKRDLIAAQEAPAPVRRQYRGLLEYLEFRLGPAAGHGQERHFYCPFCIDRIGSESSKKKLDINIHRHKASCYRCEYKAGSLERLFRDLNGGSLKLEEAAIIRGEIRLPTRDFVGAVRATLAGDQPIARSRLRPVSLPKEYRLLSEVADRPEARRAVQYLERRGCERELWDRFAIGYCWSGRYACRLVFPVIQGGQVVYFTTRYCDVPGQPPHKIKSLNEPAQPGYFTKEDVLLNYDACLGAKQVAIAEGPFSCMAFPADVPGMAGFGKSLSEHQIELIETLVGWGTEEVIIALDADAMPKIDALRSRLLHRIPRVSVLDLGDGDPWDRRVDLPSLLAGRGTPSLASRVRGRFKASK